MAETEPHDHDCGRQWSVGRIIAFSAGLGAITPLATDVYVIMLPSIARDLGATLAAAQRTMATFALGFGLAHLFVGVAADRWGRRPVAIAGLLLFLTASFAVIRAPGLEALALCRFLQGAFAACCPILSRALIRDAVVPRDMARAYATSNGLIGIAPLVAPFLAAAAAAWGGWRAALGLIVVYGAVLAVSVIAGLPETRPSRGRGDAPPVMPFSAAGQILRHPHFVVGGFAATMIYSALFTWLTTSPFLLMDGMGFSTTGVASVFGIGAGFYVVTNLVATRYLARTLSPQTLLVWGGRLMLLGSATTWLVLTRAGLGPVQLILAMSPFYIGLGLAHPNALQTVMRPFAHIAGQASAWLGLCQQIGGVAVALIAVQLGAGLAAVSVMMACCALLLVAAHRLERMPV